MPQPVQRPEHLLSPQRCPVLPAISRRQLLAQACQRGARMRLGLATGYGALLLPTIAQAKETFLPTPTSLREAATQAQNQGEPLVLLVGLPGCVWCELLRRNYLTPLRSEGVHAYQITVNDRQLAVANFQGQPSHGAAIANAFSVKYTPTLLFFNAEGEEIARRIQGVGSVDLLGAVIDARLVIARQKLQG